MFVSWQRLGACRMGCSANRILSIDSERMLLDADGTGCSQVDSNGTLVDLNAPGIGVNAPGIGISYVGG